jgi:type VI protein secretion system component VasK
MVSPYHPLHLVLGLIVWSLWFVLLYGGLSVACQFAAPDPARGASTWINVLGLGLALLVTAALLVASWRCWRASQATGAGPAPGRFIASVAAAVYALAALTTLGIVLPALLLPPCL